MQTSCVKAKIKPGCVDEVRFWFKNLLERRDEVLETLRNEGVIVESGFIDKQGDDFFLIYYMKANNLSKAYEVYKNSKSPIDLYHKDCWKKYCERSLVLEEIIDLEAF